MRGTLTIVGTGFMVAGQVTPETVSAIEGADRLLHLVSDAATRQWLESLNPRSESLYDAYGEDRPRIDSYREMVARILAPVRQGRSVCTAFYGHPGVFVDPAHEAVRRARAEGHRARMLPGISAEDCLYADLEIDPTIDGCRSWEATDFLARRRPVDPTTGMVLWQVGAIGVATYYRRMVWRTEGLRPLVETLRRHYPPDHETVVYTASPLPVCPPRIDRVPLARLPDVEVSVAATLYVPPAGETVPATRGSERPGPGAPLLTVVGTGYNVAGHVTPETRNTMLRADRLFYLMTDPATAGWIRHLHPRAVSLHDSYREGVPGSAASEAMAERIVAPLAEGLNVCAAFSGHPAICMDTGHRAIRGARELGARARMLPAISFEDCLIADLGVDPGRTGRVLHEATDFLDRPRPVDTGSALVLLQVGVIGERAFRSGTAGCRAGLARLQAALLRHYPAGHDVLLYEMPQLPIADPSVIRLPLGELAGGPCRVNSTLYVPPADTPPRDPEVLEALGLTPVPALPS